MGTKYKVLMNIIDIRTPMDHMVIAATTWLNVWLLHVNSGQAKI